VWAVRFRRQGSTLIPRASSEIVFNVGDRDQLSVDSGETEQDSVQLAAAVGAAPGSPVPTPGLLGHLPALLAIAARWAASPAQALALQRTVGNREAVRVLARTPEADFAREHHRVWASAWRQ
jgi:hypothetical protein